MGDEWRVIGSWSAVGYLRCRLWRIAESDGEEQ